MQYMPGLNRENGIITFVPGETGYTLWTILHDKAPLVEGGAIDVKVTYPVLPWIGVILLGYVAGPLYSKAVSAMSRVKILIIMGIAFSRYKKNSKQTWVRYF